MFKQYSGAVIEWMGARCRWFDPGYFNGKRTEEGARDTHWVNRRTQVMQVAWKSSLGSGAGAATLPVAFDNGSGNPRGRKRDGGRKAVRAGADDDRR